MGSEYIRIVTIPFFVSVRMEDDDLQNDIISDTKHKTRSQNGK